MPKDSIQISLKTHVQFWISIHQLKFFLLNWNPMIMPFYDINLQFDRDAKPYIKTLIFETVRHEKIDRAEARCNPALWFNRGPKIRGFISGLFSTVCIDRLCQWESMMVTLSPGLEHQCTMEKSQQI